SIVRAQTRNRSSIDNRATALRTHYRKRSPGRAEDRGQTDVQGMIPNLIARVTDGRCGRAGSEHRGKTKGIIVYEVQPPKSLQRPREHHIDICGASDICDDRDGLVPSCLDLLCDFFCVCAINVDYSNRAATLGETKRGSSADSRACS